jgi:hypothetical protein
VCSEPAAVAYGFDAARLLVWLDALVDDDRARAGALCLRHATGLTAPQGWWLDDRRVEPPELFKGPAEAQPAAAEEVPASPRPKAPRRRSRKPVAPAEPPTAVEPAPEPTTDQASLAGLDPAETPVVAIGEVTVQEVIVVEEDDADLLSGEVVVAGSIVVEDAVPPNPLLEPSSPLLARAFSGTARPDRPHRPPRSGTTSPPEATGPTS